MLAWLIDGVCYLLNWMMPFVYCSRPTWGNALSSSAGAFLSWWAVAIEPGTCLVESLNSSSMILAMLMSVSFKKLNEK